MFYQEATGVWWEVYTLLCYHAMLFKAALLYTLFKWSTLLANSVWYLNFARNRNQMVREKNTAKVQTMVDFKVEEEFTYPKSHCNYHPKLILKQWYDIFLRIYSVTGMYHLQYLFKWKKKMFCKYLLNTKLLTTSVWIPYIIQSRNFINNFV